MKRISLLLAIFCCFLTINVKGQKNYFVKENGDESANGSDWSQATSLPKALSLAVDEDTIFLAAGIYTPSVVLTNGSSDRDKCFEIKTNVTLKGGYSSVNPSLESYDPDVNKTILSGNLGDSKAYHVVVVTAPKIVGKQVSLQGLTITGGLCNGSGKFQINALDYPQSYGAALYAINANIDLRKCIITENEGTANVGCWMKNVDLTMNDSEFSKNKALNGQTAGMYLFQSVLKMSHSRITENKILANGNAAGLYLYQSKGIVDKSVIAENEATGVAGGIQIYGSSYLYIYNSTITKNKANSTAAGGIYVRSKSYLQICNSTFSENSVVNGNAGAIALHDNSRVDIISSTITSNSTSDATKTGGLYINVGCYVNTFNSILAGNGIEYGGTTANLKSFQSIVGDKYVGWDGTIENSSFVAIDHLAPLADNGGVTYTCKLIGTDNPVLSNTTSLAQMIQMGSQYAFPGYLIGKDQRGMDRDPKAISMGSYQDIVTPAVFPSDNFWHLIVYGQSLGDGYQSYPALSSTAVQGNYMIGNQVYIANENKNFDQLSPLFASPSLWDVQRNYAKSKSDGVRCENPLVGTANHIQRKLNNSMNILATSCAVSGKTIEQLSKNSQQSIVYYEDYLKTLNAGQNVAHANNFSITCPALFFMQGEYNYFTGKPGLTPDTEATTDKEEYKSLFLQLKKDMQNDVVAHYNQKDKPLFITYQTGGQYLRGFEEKISMAQLEAANANEDIVCAGPLYQMTDRGGHLDPNGYRWYGEMLGKVFYRTVVEQKDFKPLQPVKLTKVNNNTLKITFFVPYKPLVLDTQITEAVDNFGFSVKDDAGDVALTSVSLGDDTESIILCCNRDLSGKIQINYAGEEVKGHGNLRDSDPYESFYTYEDLDKKVNEEYVYPRTNNESLRPSYEPHDAEGVIYDKKYPLYNFCTHFFYEIPENESQIIVPDLEDIDTKLSDNKSVQNIKIYYLSNNQISISGEWDKVSFYNLNGMIQMSAPYSPTINTSALASGLYLVKVECNDRELSIKYLK